MKFWRIRRLANATTWSLMLFALGILAGIMLLAFLPGMPWATKIPVDSAGYKLAEFNAQLSMAAASWWMVAITALSSFVGLVGLFAILATLDQTKRSAELARKSIDVTRAQTRAYLQVSMSFDNVDQALDCILLRYKNTGQSPAKQIKALIHWSLVTVPNTLPMESSEVHAIPYLAAAQENEFATYMMNLAFDPPIERDRATFLQLLLKVRVDTSFLDVFGEPIEESFTFSEGFSRNPIFPTDQEQQV